MIPQGGVLGLSHLILKQTLPVFEEYVITMYIIIDTIYNIKSLGLDLLEFASHLSNFKIFLSVLELVKLPFIPWGPPTVTPVT